MTLYTSILYWSSEEGSDPKHKPDSALRLRRLSSAPEEKNLGIRPRKFAVNTEAASSLPSFVRAPTKLMPWMHSSP